eukprot:13269935-Alexandrium_andersonii.AAC.1
MHARADARTHGRTHAHMHARTQARKRTCTHARTHAHTWRRRSAPRQASGEREREDLVLASATDRAPFLVCADDVALLASRREELQGAFAYLVEALAEVGLRQQLRTRSVAGD